MTAKGQGARIPELKSKRRGGMSDLFSGKGKAARNLKAIFAAEHYDRIPPSQPTFANIDAPPSMLPAKKYCDITGLPSKYTDPKTKLRFESSEAFIFARKLPEHKAEEFLGLRQAHARIR
jgi:INO80 complex subunit C